MRRLPESSSANSMRFDSEAWRNAAGLYISRPILPYRPSRQSLTSPVYPLDTGHARCGRAREECRETPVWPRRWATPYLRVSTAYRDGRQARKIEPARCAGLGRSWGSRGRRALMTALYDACMRVRSTKSKAGKLLGCMEGELRGDGPEARRARYGRLPLLGTDASIGDWKRGHRVHRAKSAAGERR